MPRPVQPPRLVFRKETRNSAGKITHKAQWRIHDRGKKIETGFGESDFELAKEALTAYIVAQHNEKPLPTGGSPENVLIGDLISFYLKRNEKKIAAMSKDNRRDFFARFERLIDFWGDKYVIEIDEVTCAEYQNFGKPLADTTHRKHLEYLRAVIGLAAEKRKVLMGGLTIDYNMPSKSKARVNWYERDQIAKLVRTAYRRQRQGGTKTSIHLARFILTAVYTGTRSDRIQRASFIREPGRPWIDLENGIFYRAADGEKIADNKRADPVRIPAGLLSHMRRWHKNGARYLIEVNGKPCGTCRSSFRRLVIEVLGEEEAVGHNRHTLRHTCATWLMRVRHPKDDIARFLSCTPEIIEDVYGHFHPDWMASTTEAFGHHREKRVSELQLKKKRHQEAMQKQDEDAA
jgi:integrase